jgi:hypothetical protein
MDFSIPAADFLLRWTLILTVITIIVLSSFVIKLPLPDQYKGVWKVFGDRLETPKRALMLSLGMLIGLSLIVGLSIIIIYSSTPF